MGAPGQVSDARGTVPTEYQEMLDRYVGMTADALLRVAADPKSLTTTAREALAEELRKRSLDSPDAIEKYERERDQRIKQEGGAGSCGPVVEAITTPASFRSLEGPSPGGVIGVRRFPSLGVPDRLWNGDAESWQWPHP